MGGFTNYEVEFATDIDWCDADVKSVLERHNVRFLCLRDTTPLRAMLCVYSHSHVGAVVCALKSLYFVDIRYRQYLMDDAVRAEWTTA
jgi:hypothetical protein